MNACICRRFKTVKIKKINQIKKMCKMHLYIVSVCSANIKKTNVALSC